MKGLWRFCLCVLWLSFCFGCGDDATTGVSVQAGDMGSGSGESDAGSNAVVDSGAMTSSNNVELCEDGAEQDGETVCALLKSHS